MNKTQMSVCCRVETVLFHMNHCTKQWEMDAVSPAEVLWKPTLWGSRPGEFAGTRDTMVLNTATGHFGSPTGI